MRKVDMSIDKFIENFAEAIDVTSSEVDAELEYKSHPQWDSMAVLSLIAMVDEYYSKILTGEDIENLKTVRELYEHVSK